MRYFIEFRLKSLTAVIAILVSGSVPAQSYSHQAALSARIPVWAFAESHLVGFNAEYSFSSHRFGSKAKSTKLIGFIGSTGVGYLFGRKITLADNDFNFGGYTEAYVLGGIILNPSNKTNISVSAGPVLGFYKQVTDLAALLKINANYFVDEHISLGPLVCWRKGDNVRSLFEAGIRMGYAFK